MSLDDPNATTVVFDPEFLGVDEDQAEIAVRFLDVDDPCTGTPTSRVVGEWDFGEGLWLNSWEFECDFGLTLGIRRTADAPKGRRDLSLEIYNPHGRFLALGDFTVL